MPGPAVDAAAYLALTEPDARRQWQAVAGRQIPVAGRRQVDFVPVETLMCLAAGLIVNHRRYGGRTSHLAEEPVPSLARLFRRPNSSVLAKMANLDGSRPHGARYEIEVAAALLSEPERLAAVYRLVLRAAREAGAGPAVLPDFLGLEDGADVVLLGQGQLDSRAVEADVERASAVWAAGRVDLDRAVTERLLLGAVRIGQHRFARDVLANHAHRCVFCGLGVVPKAGRPQRMLVAGHIRPWRLSSPAQRLDARNGLTACPTHDAAFDGGLLSVGPGHVVDVSPALGRVVVDGPGAAAAFGSPPLAAALLLPAGAVPPLPAHLAWHRQNVFVGG